MPVAVGHLRGEPLGIVEQCLNSGIGRTVRCDDEPVTVGGGQAGSDQHLEEPPEEAAVLGEHPQLLAQPLRLDHLARSALPAQPLQRPLRVGPRQPLQVDQEVRPAAPVDAHILEIRRERPRVSGHRPRIRHEVGGHHARCQRAVPPDHLVEQLVDALIGREQRRPGGPLDRVGVQAAQLGAVVGVEPQVGGDDLAGPVSLPARLAQHGVADQPVPERAGEPQPLPSERQVGRAVLESGGAAGRGHHLEAAVEQQGVQLCAPAVGAVGQGHLSQGLPVAGPQRPQRPERVTELDSRIGPGPVEVDQVDRGQAGSELLQVPSLGTRRGAEVRRQRALGVLGPVVGAVGPAEDLEPARFGGGGAVEYELHLAARDLPGVLRVVIVEDHRAVELQVLHGHRPGAALRPAGRRGHGAVQRARRDDSPVHPVVVEPCRVGDKHLGGMQGLAPHRVVACAQQRMARFPPAPARLLHPVSLVLEGVAGEGDAAPGLAREQALERHVDAGAVGGCERVEEAAAVGWIRLAGRGLAHAGGDDRLDRAGSLRPGGGNGGAEDGVGTDLDHCVHGHGGQCLDAPAEGHRSAGLAPPVPAVEGCPRLQRPTGHAAHVGDLRDRGLDAVDHGLEIVQSRLHQRAVVGGALAQVANPHFLGLEGFQQALDRLGRAADDLVHPVVGGHAHRRASIRGVELVDRGRDPLWSGEHRGHGAVLTQRAHEGAAGGGKPQAVLEAERPGGLCGRDLAEAVADHHIGTDTDARPQRGESALDCVDAGLGPGRVVQLGGVAGAEHHVEQRSPSLLAEHPVAEVENRPEDGLALVEGAAHAYPLAGLAGVGEGDSGGGPARRILVAVGQRLQRLLQRPDVREDNAGAMRQMAPPHPRGPCRVGQQFVCVPVTMRILEVLLEPLQVSRGRLSQGFAGLGRQGKQAG